MIQSIIRFSVEQKLIIALLVAGLIGAGVYSLRQLPIDAVPDITNNQVQVVTVSQSLAPQEVEQFITYPVEVAMANIPNVTEIRSISRFGLSVVTIVFEDWVPILEARQYVKEQIGLAEQEIPPGLGQPELMPITTGLGEIYQYVLQPKPGYEDEFSPLKLRTIQDWIVKRQLAGIPGIIEISSFGGYLKQYEVAVDPLWMQGAEVTLPEVFEALEKNNQNTGGSYIEKNTNAYYIRTEGIIQTVADIEQIVVKVRRGVPIRIKDVATVQFGSPKRFGAMTMDGEGEAVGGITLMFKGANSSEAIQNVHDRIEEVKKSLPEGIELYPYLDRSDLVGATTKTVTKNLLEGGLIVIFVLVLLLGNFRAGLIVASVIPLAMLFALIMMNLFGVSANLMSLGAIDFGIVVDGAVIIVEGVLHTLFTVYVGKKLTQAEMDQVISESSAKLFRSAVFGVFIILVVFVPIMTLTGIEGKMFRPMAMTFSFAILGALLLSLTYVPMMAALVLPNHIREHKSFSDRLIGFLRRLYRPTIEWALDHSRMVLAASMAALVGAFLLFRSLGAEFIPTLEEGDLAMQMAIQPGSSLQESIRTTTKAERILLDHFPEVEHVVSKIGTAEVPTDPMAVEDADIMIILKEKEEWTSASDREELVDKMKKELEVVAGATFEFTQPIQLRFNELMTGAKTDIAVKIFGENTDQLKQLGDRAAALIEDIPGAGDVKVEQTEGLPQLMVRFNRRKVAQYGLNIEQLNTVVRAAYAGEVAGVVFENERKFDLVVRLRNADRQDLDLDRLFVHTPTEERIPLSEVADIEYTEGPMQISREDARRRITIGVNVRNRDVASLVADIQQTLEAQLNAPPGYTLKYGGEFENLEKARKTLGIAVPVALLLIFLLLYFTFGKIKYALLIFTAVPLSAIGGVVALWLRGMPFSISAGVGFIALFGVAVLNGIVLISHFNQLRYEDGETDLRKIVVEGGLVRMRPVLMTAIVAAMGFLPMALSTSNGAEVQKPLATVVIGGLVTATLLTLIVMPILYFLVNRKKMNISTKGLAVGLVLLLAGGLNAQPLDLNTALEEALSNHPSLQQADLEIQRTQLGEGASRRLPPTAFFWELGQVNTLLFDYRVGVEQGFQPIGYHRERRELVGLEKQGAQAAKVLTIRQLQRQVAQAWNDWAEAWNHAARLEAQLALFSATLEKAELQLERGAIDQLQQTYVSSAVARARKQLAEQQLEVARHRQTLVNTGMLNLDFDRPGIASDWLQEDLSATELSGDILAPLEQQLAAQQQQVAVQEASLNPAFSVGYFNMSIRPDIPAQGVIGTLEVPIFAKAYRNEIEREQLMVESYQTELQWQRERLQEATRFAQLNVIERRRLWQEEGSALQNEANTMRRLATLQLEAGEIDYFRFFQTQQLVLENELQALALEFAFYRALIDWTYFAG
jgi:cobalt-zinc-cadmium resistance protein CzcA